MFEMICKLSLLVKMLDKHTKLIIYYKSISEFFFYFVTFEIMGTTSRSLQSLAYFVLVGKMNES